MRQKRPANIKDVAKVAGVSIGTASRVFNRKGNVNGKLVGKVFDASRKLGFLPKETSSRVVLVTNLAEDSGEYVRNMTFMLCERFIREGMKVDLVRPDESSPFSDPRISGVIAIVESLIVNELSRIPNLPVITLTTPRRELGFHSICINHFLQGKIATRHLLQKGHRKIAFLATDRNEWCCSERMNGYISEMKKAGLDTERQLIQFSREALPYDIIARWIRNGITAILNFNHERYLEALHILNNVLDVRIGRDISTVSIEEIPGYEWMTPPQTAVRQPIEKLASCAFKELMGRMGNIRSGKGCSETLDIRLPSELIERDSVISI